MTKLSKTHRTIVWKVGSEAQTVGTKDEILQTEEIYINTIFSKGNLIIDKCSPIKSPGPSDQEY